MAVKNSFSGIKNCRKISTEVIHESLSINREDEAIIYAKCAEDSESILVVGNIGAMICLIAEMVMLISKNSGFPISAILATVSHTIIGLRGSLR